MERQKIFSSNIESVGYDENDMVLEIEFKNGSIYQYYNITATIYDGLMRAESIGKFLNSHIIKMNFKCKRIN